VYPYRVSFLAATDHDRQLQRVGKVTTVEAAGIHAAGKTAYRDASAPSEATLFRLSGQSLSGRMAAPVATIGTIG
jgi:hypothetical protein